jgi:uncharacterized protein YwqG
MGLFDFFKKKEKQTGSGTPTTDSLLEKVEVVPGVVLPKALAAHWNEIEKTRLPYISIKAMPQQPKSVQQSSFGYYPCLPKGFPYPTDSKGNLMYPLAQINCNQLPAFENYPRDGYLQFYIATDDGYGLNFDNQQEQSSFRVLYFTNDEVKAHETDFSFLKDVMNYDDVPVHKPHTLDFSLKEEYFGLLDVRYEDNRLFDLEEAAHKYPSVAQQLEDYVWDNFESNGHKMGGYAYFTQSDPRHDQNEDYILLLQIDSDKHIMWGDVGVANFFIHPDDLETKDFSMVMYNWDCS